MLDNKRDKDTQCKITNMAKINKGNNGLIVKSVFN